MILEYLFLVSGLCIALLLFTKVREMRTRSQPLLLRLISRGDERLADFSHRFAHLYADSKGDVKFFIEKQLPLYARRLSNKTEILVADTSERVSKFVRESKYFKKSGSLSDYFKSLAEGAQTDEENVSADPDSQSEHSTIE